jgi:hypothetical protein
MSNAAYKVTAMPPVARIPHRIIFGAMLYPQDESFSICLRNEISAVDVADNISRAFDIASDL